MSKIDELIKQYCPDGVIYENLIDVSKVLKKDTLTISKLLDKTTTGYPVINSGRGLYGFYSDYNNEGNAITIAARGEYAGFINYFNDKFWAGGLCYPYKSGNEKKLITKFLYYYLKNNENEIMEKLVSRGSIPAINKQDIDKIKIPVPPIQVQEEIVRILDRFANLTAELEAELESRKKQYEYYRDKLLEFSDEVEYKELDKIAFIKMGTSPKGTSISADKNSGIEFHQGKSYFGEILLKKSNIYTTEPLKITEINDIVMSVRAPVGDTNIVDRKIAIGRGLCAIHGKDELNTKFLYYYINANVSELKSKSNGTTFEAINTNDIKNFKIPVPPLKEQERIVAILDKFDNLVNDMTKEGLPAEIEKRKQQYEYYRNKLLTFKEIKK